mmetsp:Transcript_93279/g.241108  ORF Transcript_93279/g.241108 Transcript_93279/m.241108 type:complete len:290 (-) Transcript_93279:727-1596(-)
MMGRAAMLPLGRTTGRIFVAWRPITALMEVEPIMGVPSMLPKTPPLLMLKVPPSMSDNWILSSLAFFARAANSRSTPTMDSCSTLRITGTTKPRGLAAAKPMSTYSRKTRSFPSTQALMLGICIRALAAALMKMDWKPSLALWAASNVSLYCFRNSMKGDISTSWKVDRAAWVSWAFLRFLAMAIRIRGILILRSGRSAAAAADCAAGAAGASALAAGAGAAGAAGTSAAGAASGGGAPPVLIEQSFLPTSAVSSAWMQISVSTPESSAATSTVTLSVSMAAMIWPLLT